jgi:hypothetical protein
MPQFASSHPETPIRPSCRQAFHHPHTSVGSAGHWVKTAGILSPLLIGEMIKDPEQQWRWIRISAVATAVLSQALWTNKIHKEREERSGREERPRQWQR